MRILGDTEEQFEISLAPLIDMVFLLMVFFLVCTVFADPEKDLAVRVPESAQAKPSDRTLDDIIVNVRQGGVLVVNGRIVTADELTSLLAGAAAKNPKQVVRIRGDELAFHKHVVSVLDACARARIWTVSIVTRTEK